MEGWAGLHADTRQTRARARAHTRTHTRIQTNNHEPTHTLSHTHILILSLSLSQACIEGEKEEEKDNTTIIMHHVHSPETRRSIHTSPVKPVHMLASREWQGTVWSAVATDADRMNCSHPFIQSLACRRWRVCPLVSNQTPED